MRKVGARAVFVDTRVTSEEIATAFVSGPWNEEAMRSSAAAILDRFPAWLETVIRDLVVAFPTRPPLVGVLSEAIRRHPRAFPSTDAPLRIVRSTLETRTEFNQPPFRTAELPILVTTADLATYFGVTLEQLHWFTAVRPRESNVRHHHYVHQWQPKASGGFRLLEAPRYQLKSLQRRILRNLLRSVPVNECAHGFVIGRSPSTFVRPHVGSRVVVRLDLADFFSSIRASRIFALFSELGYSETVARCLTSLTTSRTPDALLRTMPRPADLHSAARRAGQIAALRQPHLPQGAPTSPILANLCAQGLDRRLRALAITFGARYTRYADDLAFSGEGHLEGALGGFLTVVGHVVRDERFTVRQEKTRVMRRHTRQHLAGIVVNERESIARADLDRLEATLFNVVRHGLDAENRDGHPDFLAHLRGRVAHASHVDPKRTRRINELLAKL